MGVQTSLLDLEVDKLWPGVMAYQRLAQSQGIPDIFTDAGGKLLQVAARVGLTLGTDRAGPDAFDRLGQEYEIKTIDINRQAKGFSTSNRMKAKTIERFRRRRWVLALFDGIELVEVFLVHPVMFEAFFADWERTISADVQLNNPKIPVKFVREIGVLLYRKDN